MASFATVFAQQSFAQDSTKSPPSQLLLILKCMNKEADTYFTLNLENGIARCIPSCLTEFKINKKN